MNAAPWQLLSVIIAGWLSRQQQQVIDYLREENRILREKIGKKRVRLNDDQRRRLAAKGKILGRRRLGEVWSECLGRMIFFGERHLRTAIEKYMEHYHFERNHQGLENRLVAPVYAVVEQSGSVERRERLGGMLNYYHRSAA